MMVMHIVEGVSLKKHTTMRLGGKAKYLATITSKHELVVALEWAKGKNLSVRMIGGGSNIVWSDKGFEGLVLVNSIKGFVIAKESAEYSYVTLGSGEPWDSVVERCVKDGLHGIEALSLIPGSSGATPIQNVGAYGQEIADTLVSVEVYDTKTKSFVTLQNEDCDFGYRTSRFKTQDNGRFLIVGLQLRLRRINPRPPYYPSVAQYFRDKRVNVVTPKVLREAVVDIREHKLPNPKKIANCGSFFANPIISKATFTKLQKKHPQIAHWEVGNSKIKISAAWLIENAGFKDFHDPKTGMSTWSSQPLVLVNERAKRTSDLLAFRDKIVDAVHEKYGLILKQEPEILGDR